MLLKQLRRLKLSRPKYSDWSVKPFMQTTCTKDFECAESPAVLSRPNSRLSVLPKKETVNQIMQPKIDELMQLLVAPVDIYTEQAQEHWNKFLTKLKSGPCARVRQHDVSVNITDIFQRMLGNMLSTTHPIIASKKRKVICNLCTKEGHSAFPVRLARTWA